MNRILRNLALSSGIALLSAASGTASTAVGAESLAQLDASIANAHRETQILARFGSHPGLRTYDLTVMVDGANAVLNGIVEDASGKALAQRIATDVGGITSVENRITIDADSARAKATDAKIEDATITATIESSLARNSATDGLDIHVDTKQGRVTLTGIARNLGQKEQAGRIAMLTNGVVALSNDIVVGAKADSLDKLKAREPQPAHAISDRQRAEYRKPEQQSPGQLA